MPTSGSVMCKRDVRQRIDGQMLREKYAKPRSQRVRQHISAEPNVERRVGDEKVRGASNADNLRRSEYVLSSRFRSFTRYSPGRR